MADTKTPDEHSSPIELLACIDDALRNGRLMTRANLAFDYLCQQLHVERRALPTYVRDMREIAVEEAAAVTPAENAEHFVDTWPAFQNPDIDPARLDTNIVRYGWPSPTLYREHETIHHLCNLIDILQGEEP